LMAYYIGQGEIANSLLQGWNELKVDNNKGAREAGWNCSLPLRTAQSPPYFVVPVVLQNPGSDQDTSWRLEVDLFRSEQWGGEPHFRI
jgi:hypothetical protein